MVRSSRLLIAPHWLVATTALGACSPESPGADQDAGIVLDAAQSAQDVLSNETGSIRDGSANADGTVGATDGATSTDVLDSALSTDSTVDAESEASGDGGPAPVPDGSQNGPDVGGGNDATSVSGDSGPTVVCPSPGAQSSDPPAAQCGAGAPVITSSGTFSFSTAGGGQNGPALPCGFSYANRRDDVYGLCLPYSRRVDLKTSGQLSALAIDLSTDCSSSLICSQFPYGDARSTSSTTWERIPAGQYSLRVESYQDQNPTLSVTLGRPTVFPAVGTCAETGRVVAQDGPQTIPTTPTIFLQDSLSSSFTPATASLVPGCAAFILKAISTSQAFLPIDLAAPTQVTVSSLGDMNPAGFSIRTQCDSPASDVACSGSGDTIISALMPAGIAYIALVGATAPEIELESPLPPATNTSCQTARVLSVPSNTGEDRIVTAGSRYYTFTTTATGQIHSLQVSINSGQGETGVTVYSACDNANAIIGSGAAAVPGAYVLDMSSAPPGTYSIVTSTMQLGTRYDIELN